MKLKTQESLSIQPPEVTVDEMVNILTAGSHQLDNTYNKGSVLHETAMAELRGLMENCKSF